MSESDSEVSSVSSILCLENCVREDKCAFLPAEMERCLEDLLEIPNVIFWKEQRYKKTKFASIYTSFEICILDMEAKKSFVISEEKNLN